MAKLSKNKPVVPSSRKPAAKNADRFLWELGDVKITLPPKKGKKL